MIFISYFIFRKMSDEDRMMREKRISKHDFFTGKYKIAGYTPNWQNQGVLRPDQFYEYSAESSFRQDWWNAHFFIDLYKFRNLNTIKDGDSYPKSYFETELIPIKDVIYDLYLGGRILVSRK
jgi:hypothetical protein